VTYGKWPFQASKHDLSHSTFQSCNPIGQNIIHNYMRKCAVALTTPKLPPNPALINPNPTNQIKALKRNAVL